LQWAREHHCRWNWKRLYFAEQRGHQDVLQWAQERGCPADSEVEGGTDEDSEEEEEVDVEEETEEEEEVE